MTSKKAAVGAPFSYGAFRTLWVSNMVTNMGVLIQSVGASWMMVEAGVTPQLVALVQTAMSLPLVLISPVSGAIADRMNRRQVMLLTQVLLMLVSSALALLAFMGWAGPWVVLTGTFLIGSCMAFNGPAWLASVGDILPRPVIPQAVAYNAIGLNLARSIGPAIGGAIVTVAGSTANFLLNAASSFFLALVLYRWRAPIKTVLPPSTNLASSIWEGVRYAACAAPIRATLLRALIFGAVASDVQALLPLVTRDLLHGGSGVFGLLFGAFGVGALTGALGSGRLRARFTPEAVVMFCTFIAVIGTLGAGWSQFLWLTTLSLAMSGAAWVIAFATFNVAIQLSVPRTIVARALSLYQMSVFAGVALGGWLGGFMADHLGTRASLSAAAVIGIVSLLAGKIAPVASVTTQDVDAGLP